MPATLLLDDPGARGAGKERHLAADQILDRFVAYATENGFSLYGAQEEAILELLAGKHVLVATPTGSGKSLVAYALHFMARATGRVSIYTCPIKALVNEKFFELCGLFGADHVGMLTGDASINAEAPILVCTAEILANQALRNPDLRADCVVMDEFHYYADRERGVAWQLPLLALPRTQFLLMSATLGDTTKIENSLRSLTERDVVAVRSASRPVPLSYDYVETPLHETIAKLVERGQAPIYLVSFTQRAAAEEAQNLTSVDLLTKAEKETLKAELAQADLRTPYGKEMRRFLMAGIGLHHAGLLPRYRLLVEKLSQRGLLKVISGTDTLGMGINIPLRTVLFTQLCKYDGEKTAILAARDFHQIAGRAGRKGFDDHGLVVAQAPAHVIENLRLSSKKAQGKKVVMQKPPQKGYVPWDRAMFERLQQKAPEPLESRFDVTHGMVLDLLANPLGGYDRLLALIRRSHGSDIHKRQLKKKAAQLFRALRHAGLIVVERRAGRHGSTVAVHGDLQRDFSLHHTLGIWLVQTLPLYEQVAGRETPSFAGDVLSLVESILENPQPVLWAQVDKKKGEAVAQMKAEGIEYEERMERLELVEHDKPLADFIYESFNEFAAHHPWVQKENVRPKSVARELVEKFASFCEYIRFYGLQRTEGILLRYLSDALRTLQKSVPIEVRTDPLWDLIEQLRLEVRSIDSSLLDEWEGRRAGRPLPVQMSRVVSSEPPWDARRVAARIRGELVRFVGALARKQWDEALACLATVEEDPSLGLPAWSDKGLEAALAPLFAAHGAISFEPAAHTPRHTTLRAASPGLWEASQRIVTPDVADEESDWVVEAVFAIGEAPGDGPLLRLRRIGN
jgi:superfamily II RNA helicase